MCASNQTWLDPHTQPLHYTWPDQYSTNYSPASCSPLHYNHPYPTHFNPAAASAIPVGKTYDYEGSYGANFFTTNYFPQTVPRDHAFYENERPPNTYGLEDSSSPVMEKGTSN